MKRILVVDDDPDASDFIESILLRKDYKVQIILEWEMVYRAAREFKPNLVLVDAYLDGVDGRIICRNLKRDQDTSHIPVIVISANRSVADSVEKYGADGFMAKPLLIDELLEVVKRYIAKDTE